MKSISTSQFDSRLEDDILKQANASEPAIDSSSEPTGIGLLVRDPVNRRLVESASAHLELVPITLSEAALDPVLLSTLEMIVVDDALADQVRQVLARRDESAEGVTPALVVVHQRILNTDTPHLPIRDRLAGNKLSQPEAYFDVELPLPMEPAAIVAQLSLILYAHRAFARRYNSTLEELHLNRRIFRSVTSGISIANPNLPDMPLIYVNPAFEVMTGYPLEEVAGKNCRFLQRGDTDQPGLTILREAIRDKREAVAVIKNYRKDGSFFWNELFLSPIRNREGELTHFVGIQTDVTARVAFEAALRESEKLAAVGRLASSIAHEINNPLESVMNLLYLAQNTEDDIELRRYLAVADKELQRVSLIAAQSLRFYKQSSKPQAIGCTELLESVIDLYLGRMENAGVVLERRERSSQSIVCMESEIRQVLNNLIRNSIDAMHGQGGRMIIRSREGTEWRSGSKGVVITVADTGSGISPATMKQIYTPFFTTKGIGGTGLGLWISSEIVDRHHGCMRVRSSQRPGAMGTVFELFLPYQGLSMG